MGLSGVSPLSLLLILLIVIVLFGSSRLKSLGSDLGEALRNFRAHASRDEESGK